MSKSSDRNLLIGILAVQMNFISRNQLITALHDWLLDTSRSLDELLLTQQVLADDVHPLLMALVEKHLERHGDADKSLATLSSIPSLRDELQLLNDAELEASVAHWAVSDTRTNDHGDASVSWSVGEATSSGRRFRILRPHAEGGLGTVSVARDSELNREVALKEIRQCDAHDPNRRNRFMMEAEITGGLEHPGVVPVYGLGQYADGRPFYAMRFIRGDSLKEAIQRFHRTRAQNRDAAERTLQLRRLLQRFVDVCEAIEYAHSRGVLHRDLKPGNVMLGKYGETLVVDWGLAKAIDKLPAANQTDESTLRPSSGSGSAPTQMGSAIGTPAYMSPEQAAGRLQDLGPASDVYSLGATLYHVLTGQPPLQGLEVGMILEKARQGQVPPARDINPDIPAPLESICRRAMALDPSRRYSSPRALADDLERYLADEVVGAYSEPFLTSARRWVRKHPRSVAALAATLLVGLLSTIVIAAVVAGKNQDLAAANLALRTANQAERVAKQQSQQQHHRARQAETLAKENAAEARQQKAAAQQAADEAWAVLEFFQNKVLVAARPANEALGLGRDVTIRAAIDAAEPQIAEAFVDQPLVEAAIRTPLGVTYYHLGEAELAIQQHQRALDLLESRLGPQHPDTLTTIANLASAYQAAGRRDEALRMHQQAFEGRTAQLGPRHPDTLLSMNNLARAYHAVGQAQKALQLYEQTLELRQTELGPTHKHTLVTMCNLAEAYRFAGRLDEAISMLEQTLDVRKAQLGPDHPSTLVSMNNLAGAYQSAGRLDLAIPLFAESLERMKAVLGTDHPNTLMLMMNLGVAYASAGKPEQGLPLLEQALESRKSKLGPTHRYTLLSMANLAAVYGKTSRQSESLAMYEETLKAMQEELGMDHPHTLTVQGNLAMAYHTAGQLDRALQCMSDLADAHLQNDEPDKALPLIEQSIAGWRSRSNSDDPDFADRLATTALDLLEYRQFSAAEAYLRECLDIRAKTMTDHWLLYHAKSSLGRAQVGQARALMHSDREAALQKLAESEPLLIDGYEGMKQREASIPQGDRLRLTEALQQLVNFYNETEDRDDADKWQAELDKRQAVDHPAAGDATDSQQEL